VQRIKAETKTAGGIFLPESSVKELNEAKVLAVGPGGLDRDGKRVSVSVAPGDRVLIPQVCVLFLFASAFFSFVFSWSGRLGGRMRVRSWKGRRNWG